MRYNPDVKPERGLYFSGKGVRRDKPYTFEQVKGRLPEPILSGHDDWLGCYWYTWSVAFKNARSPGRESGFVSDFIDAAFNQDIFLFDTVFITMYSDLARPWLPGIAALDNFYVKQQPDGEIPRELVRDTGEDVEFWLNREGLPLHSYFHNHYGYRALRTMPRPNLEEMYFPSLEREHDEIPYYTLDNLNHPLLAWGEWISYLQTGDIKRLSMVFLPLMWQYRFLRNILRHGNGLYVTDWASMDNSPRNKDLGCGIDISCEMALFALNLLDILSVLEQRDIHPVDNDLREALRIDRQDLIEAINSRMWNENSGFYYDLKRDGTQNTIKTAAAYWALAAGVAGNGQALRMARLLEDVNAFNRLHRLPVLSADEPEYNPRGGYWKGSVWPSMNTMALYGLERYGYDKLARDIALNHLDVVAKVWRNTGTIWESYPPDSLDAGDSDHPAFVGGSGIGPTRYLLRYALGFFPDAPRNHLLWKLDHDMLSKGSIGCNRLRFGEVTADLLASVSGGKLFVKVRSDLPFTLEIHMKENALTNRPIKNEADFSLELPL